MSEDRPAMSPQHRWQIGKYTFSRYNRSTHHRRLWGVSAEGYGVSRCLTPIDAFVALYRWMKHDPRPS